MLTKPGSRGLLIALSFLVGALTFQLGTWATKVRPYWDVRLISADILDSGDIHIAANFIKGDCTLELFAPIGVTFVGQRTNLVHSDLDGRGQADDRLAGPTTLRIVVHTEGVEYDNLEIRTRHNCSGLKIDKTFLTLHLEDL